MGLVNRSSLLSVPHGLNRSIIGVAASFRVDLLTLDNDYSQPFTNGSKSGSIVTRTIGSPITIVTVDSPEGFSVSSGGIGSTFVVFVADDAGSQAEFALFDDLPGYASLTTISLGN